MAWTKAVTPGMSKCDSMDIVGGKRMKQSHLSRRRKRSKKRRWGLSNWIIKVPLITQFSPCEQVGVKVQGWRWGKFWSCFILSNGEVQVAAFSRHSGIWIWRSRDNVTDCAFKNGHYFPPPHALLQSDLAYPTKRDSLISSPLRMAGLGNSFITNSTQWKWQGTPQRFRSEKAKHLLTNSPGLLGLQTPTHGT